MLSAFRNDTYHAVELRHKIAQADRVLAHKIEAQGEFLTAQDVGDLAAIDRLMPILVRCGNGRFICPAQDVDHFCDLIDRSGRDYVRDTSLPA